MSRLSLNRFRSSQAIGPKPNQIAWGVLLLLTIVTQQNCGPAFKVDDTSLHSAQYVSEPGNSQDPNSLGNNRENLPPPTNQPPLTNPTLPNSQLCPPYSTRSCLVTNGQGLQTCSSDGMSWGNCQVTSCQSGYQIQGNQCVEARCANQAINFPTCNQCASDKIWSNNACMTIDQLSSPCPEASYSNFRCYQRVFTIASGHSYQVRIRWNRGGQSSNGTVLWVSGGDGSKVWRELDARAAAIQDEWRNQGIRSVELQFIDGITSSGGNDLNTGYWRHAGGYQRSSAAYFEALKFVHQYLRQGSFLNHIGGSNGTMVAAYALAYYSADQYLNRVIFHAGPFLPDMRKACSPRHFASFDRSSDVKAIIYNFLSHWIFGGPGRDPCQDLNTSSILGLGARHIYPSLAIHSMMGEKEMGNGFGAWIIHSHESWFHQVVAAEKTYLYNRNLGHEMDWDEIRRHGIKSPPAGLSGEVRFYFTNSPGGNVAISQVSASQPIYGVVTGVGVDEGAACWAEESNFEEYCGNPRNWSPMPNRDWSYQNGRWLAAWPQAGQIGQSGKTYRGAWMRTRTGQKGEFSLKIVP